MSLADEIRVLTDPDRVPTVYALERYASRRGRSWVIDFVVIEHECDTDRTWVTYLRHLAVAAGFPPADRGNVIRADQIVSPIDDDNEWRPMWWAMQQAVHAHVTAAGGTVGHLDEITPRWL